MSLRFQITAFIAVKIILHTITRMVYPFLEAFAAGLGVNVGAAARAVALRSAAGGISPFLASIADSRGRRAGMLTGLLCFTAGAGLLWFWPTLPGFTITLALTIIGSLVFVPSMQAYLGDRVPYDRRGHALALTEFGWSLTFILAVPACGFLIARYGWLAPFPVLTVLGLLGMILVLWVVPADPALPSGRPSMWSNLRSVVSYPPALAGLSVGMLFSGANEIVNLVFGVWMGDAFGLQLTALGGTAVLIGLIELGGEGLSSRFTDRLGKPRSVALGLALNALSALALPLIGRSAAGATAGLLLFYLTFEFTVVSSLPLLTEIFPPARASLMALNIAGMQVGRAFGALLAHPLYEYGIWMSGLAVVGFNLLALLALRFVRLPAQPTETLTGEAGDHP